MEQSTGDLSLLPALAAWEEYWRCLSSQDPPSEDKWEEGHSFYLYGRLPAGPGKELGMVLAGPTVVPAKLSEAS